MVVGFEMMAPAAGWMHSGAVSAKSRGVPTMKRRMVLFAIRSVTDQPVKRRRNDTGIRTTVLDPCVGKRIALPIDLLNAVSYVTRIAGREAKDGSTVRYSNVRRVTMGGNPMDS
jgi:hypothetical protein